MDLSDNKINNNKKMLNNKPSDFSIDHILNRAGHIHQQHQVPIILSPLSPTSPRSPTTSPISPESSSVNCLVNYQISTMYFNDRLENYDNNNINQQNDFINGNDNLPMLNWLQYTRYCPPRLPKSTKSTINKRTPGRLPRVPFTTHQLRTLEIAYKNSPYLSSEDAQSIATKLELTSTRVKIWYQNRRARARREVRETDREKIELPTTATTSTTTTSAL